MRYFIGIDDAGRGPVVGPMVLAGVLANEKQIEQFKLLKVRDSKMLTARQREFLASKIKKIATDYKIIKVPASEIDENLVKGINLNKVEALKMAEAINQLTKKVRAVEAVEVIVDCPSTNIAAWCNYLIQHIENKEKIKLKCEHKADMHYVVVSAASIIAKVTRDAEIEKIKKQYGIECGSGYPSDPLCINFLKTSKAKELAKLGLIRKSWQTWKVQEGKKWQKRLGEF